MTKLPSGRNTTAALTCPWRLSATSLSQAPSYLPGQEVTQGRPTSRITDPSNQRLLLWISASAHSRLRTSASKSPSFLSKQKPPVNIKQPQQAAGQRMREVNQKPSCACRIVIQTNAARHSSPPRRRSLRHRPRISCSFQLKECQH